MHPLGVGRVTAHIFFATALVLSVAIAYLLSGYVERENRKSLEPLLKDKDFGWLQIDTDGLLVGLHGEAPGKIQHITALSAVQSVIAPSRVIDNIVMAEKPPMSSGEYVVRLLQENGEVKIFGELPDSSSHEDIIRTIADVSSGSVVDDLSIRHADEPTSRWNSALQLGLEGFKLIPGADLHVTERKVTIEGELPNQDELERVRSLLFTRTPDAVSLNLEVSAPRPLQVPFVFDLRMTDGDSRILACHAESEGDRDRILDEIAKHGSPTTGNCDLARGAPSDNWAGSVTAAIDLLASAGGGRLRIEDFVIFASPLEDGETEEFNQRINDGLDAIPDQFVVQLLPAGQIEGRVSGNDQDEVLRVEISPDRRTEIRGRVGDESGQRVINAFAKATLAPPELVTNLDIDPSVSSEITWRVLAGLEALALLNTGRLAVSLNSVEVSGTSSFREIDSMVSELLASKLPAGSYTVNVAHDASIGAKPPEMDPGLCASLATEIVETQKLSFEPGSATLKADVIPAIQQLAVVLQNCTHAPIEIAGYTDSQGRQEMNLALSTRRARAVLDALLEEGVLTQNFSAVGYGESQPIASNETEAGREKNRRIEFRIRDAGTTALPQ